MTAEQVKQASHHLRGQIIDELAAEAAGFTKDTTSVLKFHGIYQQNDRDVRKSGGTPIPGCMVRVGVPGGVLTAGQYLALDRLAEEAGVDGLRITSRQDIQFHGVLKSRLKALMRGLHECYLTTLAACGDVVRNVCSCPAPLGEGREQLLAVARDLSRRFKPRSGAYYEVWLDGEKALSVEPLYGDTYLPRKFKIGFAPAGDNCTDVYSNDVGIVPAGDRFTVLVGGGLGMSPGVRATHPALAQPLGTVEAGRLAGVVEAVIAIHRDFGNRQNRKLARLKYVLEAWGIERFRAEVEARVGAPLDPPEPLEWESGDDHLGWHRQPDGRWFLGLRIVSGRLRGELREAVRRVVERHQPSVHLTTQQNLLFTGIAAGDRSAIQAGLRSAGVRFAEQLPPVLRLSMACPALPTCGLAVTEAERVLPEVVADVRGVLARFGLADEPIVLRMTGCSNGCARPYTAEIGLAGESVNLYRIYLGGSRLGTRLAELFAEKVPREGIGEALVPAIALYSAERQPGETFGDFCARYGVANLREPAYDGVR